MKDQMREMNKARSEIGNILSVCVCVCKIAYTVF